MVLSVLRYYDHFAVLWDYRQTAAPIWAQPSQNGSHPHNLSPKPQVGPETSPFSRNRILPHFEKYYRKMTNLFSSILDNIQCVCVNAGGGTVHVRAASVTSYTVFLHWLMNFVEPRGCHRDCTTKPRVFFSSRAAANITLLFKRFYYFWRSFAV